MVRYLLNIGLLESSIISDGRRIHAEDALGAVRETVWAMFDWAAAVTAHAVHESDSEPTLIVELCAAVPADGRVRALADALCARLRQEAIAIARLDAGAGIEWGDLRGPLAARWGDFNPEYFLMLNGERAVERAVAAAA